MVVSGHRERIRWVTPSPRKSIGSQTVEVSRVGYLPIEGRHRFQDARPATAIEPRRPGCPGLLRGWVQGQWARTRRPQDTDHFRLERTRDRRRAISIGLIAGAVAGLGVMAFGEVGDRSLQPLGASFTVGVDDNGARYIAIEPAALSTESGDHDPAKAGGEWHGSPVLLFRVEGRGPPSGTSEVRPATHSTTPPPPPGNNPGPQPNPQPLPGPVPSPGPAPSPDPRPTPRPSPAPDPSPTIDPSPTVDPSPTPDPSPTVDPPPPDPSPTVDPPPPDPSPPPDPVAHAGSTA